ncbi:MAG: hypothetical protein ACC644_04465 [Candidatus Hydrothermarchaeales archaeon]
MKKKKDSDAPAEKVQDELEESELKPDKYEARYKHGGPGRTVKKKHE